MASATAILALVSFFSLSSIIGIFASRATTLALILNGNEHFELESESYHSFEGLFSLKKRQWQGHFVDGNEDGNKIKINRN